MDTQSLQAFISVAETESFSLAAQRLHLTQPAVSKRIANLEETLDELIYVSLTRSNSGLYIVRTPETVQKIKDLTVEEDQAAEGLESFDDIFG